MDNEYFDAITNQAKENLHALSTMAEIVAEALRLRDTGWTPAPKVDPLEKAMETVWEVFRDHWDYRQMAEYHRELLAANGLKIVSEDNAEPVSEGQLLKELAILYNHKADDSPQFTRWQMVVAIAHGLRLSTNALAAERRAGIEAARVWCHHNTMFDYESDFDAKFCRDLLGGAGDA